MMDMPSRVAEFKALVTVIFTAITALIGWQGWLVAIWVFAMFLDYITGSVAAAQRGEWSTKVARAGLWHKGGTIAIALVAAMMDLALHVIAQMGLGFELPWKGAVIFPTVVTWYIITEFGSIVENVILNGGPCPKWLLKYLKVAKDTIDSKAEQPFDGYETEHSATEDSDHGEKTRTEHPNDNL